MTFKAILAAVGLAVAIAATAPPAAHAGTVSCGPGTKRIGDSIDGKPEAGDEVASVRIVYASSERWTMWPLGWIYTTRDGRFFLEDRVNRWVAQIVSPDVAGLTKAYYNLSSDGFDSSEMRPVANALMGIWKLHIVPCRELHE